MKRRFFAMRLAAFLLAVMTLGGCLAACHNGKTLNDTIPATNENTQAGTNTPGTNADTDADTEVETDAPVIWEEYVAPEGADITDLSVSGTLKGDGALGCRRFQ